MTIKWHGQSCFQITANPGQKVNIVIDSAKSRKADVFLISYSQPQSRQKVGPGAGFLIEGPGEYETKGIFFQGISAQKQGMTYYIIEAEEMRLAHLAELPQKELTPSNNFARGEITAKRYLTGLTDEQLEEIGNVDILMLGTQSSAPKIISQIEPAVVIPMYEKGSLNKFLKTMGQKSIAPQDKLTIKAKDLPKEETKIVVLKP